MCCCFSRKEVILISDLQQVIVEHDADEFDTFSVSFKLVDGRKVYGGYDSNIGGQGKRVYKMIRNVLPQNIVFGGNLAN